MFRSSRFAFLSLAVCAAAGAFVSAAVATRDYVVTSVARVWNFAISAFVGAAQVQPKSPSQVQPCVALLAARSFVARMLRRDRPAVTPGWRLCPSA